MNIFATIITASLLAAACGNATQSASSVEAAVGKANIAIATDADNNGSVTVRQGISLIVKLKSHSDGGYKWTIKNVGGLNQPQVARDTSGCKPPPVVGCSGLETFYFNSFEGIKPGAYKIELVEMRFGREPGATYTVTVNYGDAPVVDDGVVAVESDNGKTLDVAKGKNFSIKMKSHSDGGYSWTLKNAGGLDQPSYKHDTSSCAPNVVGCSGYEVFAFSTANAPVGTYTVSLVEMRFGRNPGTTYSVTLNIK